MCGIAGFWELQRGSGKSELKAAAEVMCEKLRHRGPDDSGSWVDQSTGIALAHTRLAIIDLSKNGSQPMHSASGRFVISYNGEVYNFPQLKDELSTQGVRFKGHSDTEVILESIDTWGITRALNRFVGMFAFALWDNKEQRLILARDRIGEKPLYYGISGGTFMFGSELKALRTHHNWNGEIDRSSLSLYFRHNYVPEP